MAATRPYVIRFGEEVREALRRGARRTAHKEQDLIRLTLRRYLPRVIEEEALQLAVRITNVEPLPKGVMKRAYKEIAREGWRNIEDAAARAQANPDFEQE